MRNLTSMEIAALIGLAEHFKKFGSVQQSSVGETVKDLLNSATEQFKKNGNKIAPIRDKNGLYLAMEFGYKQAEKGHNIEMATINFNKTINQ